jgi:hypothetical protein
MSLPITLQYGYVSVYGAGLATGVSGIVPTIDTWRFGNVEQVSPYGINNQLAGSYIGCHVVFRREDAQLAIQYDNAIHTIINQNKLAGFSEQTPLVLP